MKEKVLFFICGLVVGYVALSISGTQFGHNPAETATHSEMNNDSTNSQLDQLLNENANLKAQINTLKSQVHTLLKSDALDVGTSSSTATVQHINDKEEASAANPFDNSQQQNQTNQKDIFNAIANHSVLPVSRNLSHQLALDESVSTQLEQLLQEKAQKDYLAWQGASEGEQLPKAQVNAQLTENAHEYTEALQELLSEEQLNKYIEFEHQQAKIAMEQRQRTLQQTLGSVELDDFQKQEVTRLSKELYSLGEIGVGNVGSPYGTNYISINYEKLNELKDLFTEEQRAKLGM
ncbi:hypothetical protein [Pseudoalteromonas sp. PS5]|uniref:hypothetical protein n=1 Tax=Pseudoalteromonas sp. PS5 TaxID=1437473 RepID=UPI000FFF3485|nr:hypothetical protein [Pseudoalteromonas sp. PS5]RXF05596.1 hypothetical protein D9603_03675 [Pseudoalteromonas sp. PS5]